MLLQHLVEKLPSNLRLDWARVRSLKQRVDISTFDEWLYNLAMCASSVIPVDVMAPVPSTDAKTESKRSKPRLMVHDVKQKSSEPVVYSTKQQSTVSTPDNCLKCSSDHRLDECEKFLGLAPKDRVHFVRTNKLCWRCFGKHFLRQCRSKQQCGVDGCAEAHHVLLHTAYVMKKLQSGANDNNNGSAGTAAARVLHADGQSNTTLFRYVPVTLYGRDKAVDTFALLDEGSACTLIEDKIATEMGFTGPTEELCLRWTSDITHSEPNSKKVTLEISARHKNARRYTLRNVRTMSSLDLPVQSLNQNIFNKFPILQNLPILMYQNVRASIIIGLDNSKLGVPLKIKEAEDNDLIAAKSRLGWSVYGRSCSQHGCPQRVMHICQCNDDGRLEDLVKANYSLESFGVCVSKDPVRSKDDERSFAIMENTARYLASEKRWEIGLLWRFDKIELPPSQTMALQRLKCLEAKMQRDESLKEFVHKQIDSYLQKGYIRKLLPHEVKTGPLSWFIPIFTVTSKNKAKSRLVWDAAAKVDGVALNSVLLAGPDVLPSLVGVLMRFREKAVAICGDIREMYLQVRVREADQAVQQFLWRYDCCNEPDVYIMQVMTFGAACSPSLANYVKNRNALRFESEFPEEVAAIIGNTYVDDWLQSCDSEAEMIQMARRVRDIHIDGGMEMRNWISNSASVLKSLTGSPEPTENCVDVSSAMQERVLGMWWLPLTDEFTFKQKFDESVFNEQLHPTKRHVLRVTMTIFDPLGLLGFYVVHAKIILQAIWRSGTGWDEPIREDERRHWYKWVRFLPFVETVRVPRCMPLVRKDNHLQLHIFTDASINAYAAVAFVRAEYDGEVKCSLVASKTRVAPLRPISIPRLELLGALLGLRLATTIEKELSVSVVRRVFWTDSKDVLFWIRSDARSYHQFVALRLGEILEHSHANEWRWVPSAEKVADDATKWTRNFQFDKHIRWFVGPEFLYKPETEWPKTDLSPPLVVHERVNHVSAEVPPTSLLAVAVPDVARFSKWEKYRNAQRFVMKYLRLSIKKPLTSPEVNMLCRVNSVDNAELIIFRVCQEEFFGIEMNRLRRGEGIGKHSKLYKLSPYLDDNGLMRLHGRIDQFEGCYRDTKRPVILPGKHSVTRLIVDFYHRKCRHKHNEIVVNEMRQRFFIFGLRVLVRSVAAQCQHCRNNKALPYAPMMGDLPSERLSIEAKPFTYTGVDLFGPIDTAVGRRREKRWGVLFTCLTVRAVHIEITPSLSTDAFLLAFQMFVSRRGVPRRVVSDNGTNFRGASRLFEKEIKRISTDALEQRYPEIEWRFIPPASPHMGGAWERMIRSTKSLLHEILSGAIVQEHVLRATLAEIESILNSRPLTYVPIESYDADVLTPNHFLRGGSGTLGQVVLEHGEGIALARSFQITRNLAKQFQKKWIRECLPHLLKRSKWFESAPDPITIGDVVVIFNESSDRSHWAKGIVMDLHADKDGTARTAIVKTTGGLVTRPVVKLAKIDVLRK